MRKFCLTVSVLAFGAGGLLLGGCGEPKEAAAPAAPQKPDQYQPVMNGDIQPRRDAVPVINKGEQGIHYNPRDWVAGTYNPDKIGSLLTSTGQVGLTQQTFTESGGDLQVAISPDGKMMSYASTRFSRTPQICMQGVNAKAVQLMTQDNMSDMMPSFSPDGKLLAWCSDRYGNWDILVQKADARPDSKPKQITRSTDDDIHPSWSPDSRFLTFSRFNSMDGNWQIWVVDTKSDTMSFLTEGLFPNFKPIMEKSAEGKPMYTVVFQRNRKRDVPWYSIWTNVFTVEENGVIEAVNAPSEIIADDKWAAITPCWSPNGEYIAFATVGKSALAQWQARIYKPDDIWVVRVDGTDLTQITNHSAPDWNPYWGVDANNPADPNGRIFFTSERTGSPNVWSVKPIIAGMVAAGNKTK